MLISENSILYKLPKELSRRDLLILDSLRFTLELVEYNYSLLQKELERISYNLKTENDKYKKDIIPLFNAAWTIIDNIQRFIKLYQQLPSDNRHVLIKDLRVISPLRNTFQHMDERIDECLLQYDMPFYGVISWELNFGEKDIMHKFYAISGLYIPKNGLEYRIEKKNIPINKILDIQFKTFVRQGRKQNEKYVKKEICFSALYEKLSSIMIDFEKSLENQFLESNTTFKDWRNERDIIINAQF